MDQFIQIALLWDWWMWMIICMPMKSDDQQPWRGGAVGWAMIHVVSVVMRDKIKARDIIQEDENTRDGDYYTYYVTTHTCSSSARHWTGRTTVAGSLSGSWSTSGGILTFQAGHSWSPTSCSPVHTALFRCDAGLQILMARLGQGWTTTTTKMTTTTQQFFCKLSLAHNPLITSVPFPHCPTGVNIQDSSILSIPGLRTLALHFRRKDSSIY